MQIANKSKVKQSIDDYVARSKTRTKAGALMSRQAHMELAIRENLNVNLGDIIYYVNNGTKASHGDVQKVNKPKKGWAQEHLDSYYQGYGTYPDDSWESIIQLNCYRLDPIDLENNPDMLGEYNIQRAIVTFNKRVEPLLVVFQKEVRNNLLIKNPEERGFFTTEQCQLINGQPFKEEDQDKLEDVMEISNEEMEFWTNVGVSPFHMYKLADPFMMKFLKEDELRHFETVGG
jgi:hypothetical protein